MWALSAQRHPSWLALRPECEVILFGDDEGTASCAQEFGLQHIAGIACTEYGHTLLDDAFSRRVVRPIPAPLLREPDVILPTVFAECVQRLAGCQLFS